ncbi:AAA domain-containing protein [Pseudomonas linyingensis]|uniref:AAA domain-containing protein n=1 Tax=Pseudomonas linyingensis TaxID=915471 RepID=A0A1H6Z3U1_9PSED|nr:ATP-binding protein [Pseudomonas linyingensis]SEJ48101.1 AAA domain-containing protein [Pseudomonas linyingensis]
MDISEARIVQPHLHPLCLERYLIPTDSISATYAMVLKVIHRRDSGLVIYGNPRYGKTRAMMYCQHCLNVDFPDMPVAIFNAKDEASPHKGNFYTTFLEVVKSKPFNGRVSLADKHSRLVKFMVGEADRDLRRLFILFIDEAQRLMLSHYEWIKDIYNDLALQGVTLLPILLGQKELLGQKDAFECAGKDAIVSRFMLYEHAFRGIREKDDFVTCLGYYDSSVFPVNTNWTYTRFFFPKAYANGFRLADFGDELWAAFVESYDGLGFRSRMEIPMKYFTKTIEILMMDYSDKDYPEFSISKDLCKEVIKESWYLAATSSMKKMNPSM